MVIFFLGIFYPSYGIIVAVSSLEGSTATGGGRTGAREEEGCRSISASKEDAPFRDVAIRVFTS